MNGKLTFTAAHDMLRLSPAQFPDDRPAAPLAGRWLSPVVRAAHRRRPGAVGADQAGMEAAPIPPEKSIDRVERRHLSRATFTAHALRIAWRARTPGSRFQIHRRGLLSFGRASYRGDPGMLNAWRITASRRFPPYARGNLGPPLEGGLFFAPRPICAPSVRHGHRLVCGSRRCGRLTGRSQTSVKRASRRAFSP